MSGTKIPTPVFVITKSGMDSKWYLYTVEQVSFGKRISWTKNYNDALMFTSEEKVESFKSKMLGKIPITIHKVLQSALKT